MDGEQSDNGQSLAGAAPGLARIAAGVAWRTTGWAAATTLRASARVFTAAARGESPAELLSSTGIEVRDYARRLLGVPETVVHARAAAENAARRVGESDGRAAHDSKSLREQGAELLRRSADVHLHEEAHPAYRRILSELAPDEGRILRLLATDGPQAAVDVRASGPLHVTSQLVAPGLTMIGPQAGCRYLERVPAYLNNLFRLGLVWFSREPVGDISRYQVLEAQPEVIEAVRRAGRARTVRRSIHLTPFGEDFCDTCLPLGTAEIEALPGDGASGGGSSPSA